MVINYGFKEWKKYQTDQNGNYVSRPSLDGFHVQRPIIGEDFTFDSAA